MSRRHLPVLRHEEALDCLDEFEELTGPETLPARKPRVRARTISIKRLSKRELEMGRLLYPPSIQAQATRPRTRLDCLQGPGAQRPCPWVTCKHHLYLEVDGRTGSIKLNFPDLEVGELTESCALDIADRGGWTLEDVAHALNLTRERVRQIEDRALTRLSTRPGLARCEEPDHDALDWSERFSAGGSR